MNLQSFLKWIIYSSLAIIPLLAWYVSDQTFFPYVTGKNFAFRFLIEISFIAWIVLAARDVAYRPKSSIVFYSFSAFLVVMFIANLFGVNPYNSFYSNFERMEGWFTHLHLFMYFVVLYSVFKTDKDWAKIFGWFTVGNIGVSLQALMQAFGQKDFFLTKMYPEVITTLVNTAYPTTMGGGFRLDSTLGNSAYYGIYTLFFVFLFAKMAITNNKWNGAQGFRYFWALFLAALLIISERFISIYAFQTSNPSYSAFASFVWLLGAALFIGLGISFVKRYVAGNIGSYIFAILSLLNLGLLYYTQTRGSYFGFIGGVIVAVYCVISVKILKKIKQKSMKILAGLGMSVFALATPFMLLGVLEATCENNTSRSIFLKRICTINVPGVDQIVNSIKNETYPEMIETFGETTIVSRILNGKMSVEGLLKDRKSTLLGYGQENYSVVFSENFDPRMYAQEPWFDRAHNVFFDWLTSGGILGLIAYMALYLTPIYMLWASRGRNNIGLYEKATLTGLLVAYFIHNIFVFDNIISLILFVTILAYIASRTRETDSVIAHESKSKEVSIFQKNAIMGVGIIVVLFLLINTTIKPLMANLELMRALMATSSLREYSQVPDALANTLKSTRSAIELGTFANNEVVEQSLSKVLLFSQINYSQVEEKRREETAKNFNEYKALIETEAYKFINNSPNARNLSIMATYERALNNLTKAEELAAKAYAVAPNKFGIVFEYVDILIAVNKKEEAYKIAKELFEKEKTHLAAEEKYITAAATAGKKKEAKDQLEDLRKRNKESAERLDATLVALLK